MLQDVRPSTVARSQGAHGPGAAQRRRPAHGRCALLRALGRALGASTRPGWPAVGGSFTEKLTPEFLVWGKNKFGFFFGQSPLGKFGGGGGLRLFATFVLFWVGSDGRQLSKSRCRRRGCITQGLNKKFFGSPTNHWGGQQSTETGLVGLGKFVWVESVWESCLWQQFCDNRIGFTNLSGFVLAGFLLLSPSLPI